MNCITPPHLLKKLLESKDKEIREAALSTLLSTARARGEREVRALARISSAPSNGRRTIFDCRTSTDLSSARIVRTEAGEAPGDGSVNRAFDGLGATRDFYKDVLGRASIDDRGMRIDGYVHRGVRFNNAFWDGQEMIFGDGDGVVFTDFTGSLDVIAHELTHGVTQFSAGLEYEGQSGALNESVSDVFGTLVKQWSLGQAAADGDWLIGAEIFTPDIEADALRSMKAPGTAYDNDLFGRDPQPDHMDRFAVQPNTEEGDWGGVHTNSGIPNKAFYLAAIGMGGNAWDAPGHIWYESLLASNPSTQFQDFADTTFMKAGQLYGTATNSRRSPKLGGRWASVSQESRRVVPAGAAAGPAVDPEKGGTAIRPNKATPPGTATPSPS